MKAIGKLILIALVLGAAAIAVYIKYQSTITKLFESTYLFHRISYANIVQSQDLLSFSNPAIEETFGINMLP